jgi:hypothetical protein
VLYMEVTLFRCVVLQGMDGQAPKLLQPFVSGCDAGAPPSLIWEILNDS